MKDFSDGDVSVAIGLKRGYIIKMDSKKIDVVGTLNPVGSTSVKELNTSDKVIGKEIDAYLVFE